MMGGTRRSTAQYWKNEMTGVLRPAVEAFLYGEAMTDDQIAAMRAYLRQWIADDDWQGPMVDPLRTQVNEIVTQNDIRRWIERAIPEGMNPL